MDYWGGDHQTADQGCVWPYDRSKSMCIAFISEMQYSLILNQMIC